MGLIRKTMSLGTAGLVDFRSDKERTAAYTKAAKKESKKQTQLMQAQAAQDLRARAEADRAAHAQAARPAALTAPTVSVAEELTKLAGLRDAGVLTEDEFATQKARLLG
jgi:hypothetical protein